jgi:hypothetical protein
VLVFQALGVEITGLSLGIPCINCLIEPVAGVNVGYTDFSKNILIGYSHFQKWRYEVSQGGGKEKEME